MQAFRDFHLIRGLETDFLFFPESAKVYVSPVSNAEGIQDYLDKRRSLPEGLSDLLGKEEALAQEAVSRRRFDSLDEAADSLCLYMAHDCNLSCSYCYNDGGRGAGSGSTMDGEVIEAAFRRYFTETGRTYAASFYGGEPLLNFKGMKEAVGIGRRLEGERGIRIVYSMTTNGMLLNREIVRFIDEHVSTVTVSLDGPKEINDRHRKRSARSAESGSHDKVIRNLKRLKTETKAKITIKGTLTGDAVPRYEESIRYLQQLPSDGVVLTPANTPPDNWGFIDEKAYRTYVDQEVRHCGRFFTEADSMRGHEDTVNMVVNLLTRRKFFKHCDAGKNPAVTADGSLYACHGLVGIPEFYMGNVREELPADCAEVVGLFDRLNVQSVTECRQCWARYLCGGSCYAHAYFNNGDIFRPNARHCELVKAKAERMIVGFVAAMADSKRREFVYQAAKAMFRPAVETAHG